MKPFNLEEAKAGKPVCTRDGRSARIICFDKRAGTYPIVALIENYDKEYESIDTYTEEGKSNLDDVFYAKPEDLMMMEEKEVSMVAEDEEPKCPFKPFDKVLVRDTDMSEWDCEFFSKYTSDKPYPFYCLHNVYKQCIPYNEETEHLIGTTDAAPEKYVIW